MERIATEDTNPRIAWRLHGNVAKVKENAMIQAVEASFRWKASFEWNHFPELLRTEQSDILFNMNLKVWIRKNYSMF